MKALLFAAAAAGLAAIAAPAFAETDASVGYSSFDVGSSNLNAITGRVGWNSNDMGVGFGVEGEGSFGLGDDSTGTGASRVSNKLSSEFGVFGVLSANTEGFSAFARAGWANIDGKQTLGTGTTATHSSDSDSGFAYGAGASLNLGDMSAVRLDYTHYDVNLGATTTPVFKGNDANMWSLSFVGRFK